MSCFWDEMFRMTNDQDQKSTLTVVGGAAAAGKICFLHFPRKPASFHEHIFNSVISSNSIAHNYLNISGGPWL
jgi:hypothetical protein